MTYSTDMFDPSDIEDKDLFDIDQLDLDLIDTLI